MTSADALVSGFSAREIPLLSSIPVVGKALFSHNILVYLGILVAAAVWWYLTWHQDRPAPALRGGEPRRCRLGGRQHPAV